MELEPLYYGGGYLMDEISANLGKFARLNDAETYASDGDENSEQEDKRQEILPNVPQSIKYFEKSATFPCPGKASATLSDSNDIEPEVALRNKEPMRRSLSMPKLVSAMKGTREKLGAEPRKLNVKWAPDVYDPIPNSLSHTVKSKPKKSRKDKHKNNHNKKNGKKVHKGNSSRGLGGNNKQQSHKLGGNSDHCYRPVNPYESRDDNDGIEVGSPDYCSSRFLKTSLTKVHYSVAEAL